jgi:hypothetical protein
VSDAAEKPAYRFKVFSVWSDFRVIYRGHTDYRKIQAAQAKISR